MTTFVRERITCPDPQSILILLWTIFREQGFQFILAFIMQHTQARNDSRPFIKDKEGM